MAVVVVLEAVARSVDACKSSFFWMSIAMDDLCSLRVFRIILVAFSLIAAFFKFLVLHTNCIHAVAVIIVLNAVDISSSFSSSYGLSSWGSSCLFSVQHQQGERM